MGYVRPDKHIRSAGLGLPADLIDWIKAEAQDQGIPASRLATQVMEAYRRRRERERKCKPEEQSV